MKTFGIILTIASAMYVQAAKASEVSTEALVTPNPSAEKMLEFKSAIQKHYEFRLTEVLDKVVGKNNVKVRVNVDINSANTVETISDFDPNRSIVISETSSADSSEVVRYENKKVLQKRETPAGSIKNITATVLLDESRVKVSTNEEKLALLGKIDDIVEKTLGMDKERGDRVSLHFMNFAQIKNISPALSQSGPNLLFYGYLAIGFLALLFAISVFLYLNSRISGQDQEQLVNAESPTESIDLSQMSVQDKIKHIARTDPEATMQALRKYLRS